MVTDGLIEWEEDFEVESILDHWYDEEQVYSFYCNLMSNPPYYMYLKRASPYAMLSFSSISNYINLFWLYQHKALKQWPLQRNLEKDSKSLEFYGM